MEYFVIFSLDIAESSAGRARFRDSHRQRLQALQDEGRLLTAGPLPKTDAFDQPVDGCQGSLIIAAFDSLEDARQWANMDPYYTEGVYMETTVYPYQHIFQAQDNS